MTSEAKSYSATEKSLEQLSAVIKKASALEGHPVICALDRLFLGFSDEFQRIVDTWSAVPHLFGHDSDFVASYGAIHGKLLVCFTDFSFTCACADRIFGHETTNTLVLLSREIMKSAMDLTRCLREEHGLLLTTNEHVCEFSSKVQKLGYVDIDRLYEMANEVFQSIFLRGHPSKEAFNSRCLGAAHVSDTLSSMMVLNFGTDRNPESYPRIVDRVNAILLEGLCEIDRTAEFKFSATHPAVLTFLIQTIKVELDVVSNAFDWPKTDPFFGEKTNK